MKLYFTTFDSGFSFRGQIYELISGIQNENTILFIFPSEKNFEATATVRETKCILKGYFQNYRLYVHQVYLPSSPTIREFFINNWAIVLEAPNTAPRTMSVFFNKNQDEKAPTSHLEEEGAGG